MKFVSFEIATMADLNTRYEDASKFDSYYEAYDHAIIEALKLIS